jgi:hypothetical protein
MALRIKVPRGDFESATSDSWVDGLLHGRREIWVYVELGTEQEYIPSPTMTQKPSISFLGDVMRYLQKARNGWRHKFTKRNNLTQR